MGAVHFSIDPKLIERLKELLPLTTFVETGTFQGDTLVSALPFFDKLYSAEVIDEHYRAAAQRFASNDAIELHQGDSAEFLGKLAPELANESVLYWLDAHWCMTTTPSDTVRAQCPLLGELAALETLNADSIVLVDDARYFLAPPPSPNDPGQWPSFDEVLSQLRALSSDHEVSVSNDVIIFSPKRIGAALRAFLQSRELDWLEVLQRAEDRDRKLATITQALQDAESDRSSRLAAIQALREGLRSSEADLRTCEADRAQRLEVIHELDRRLAESEADRAARLETIDALQAQLKASEADRAARLGLINDLDARLQASEADRAARLEAIDSLKELLDGSEAARAAHLDIITELEERLRAIEADHAARLDAIQSLQASLQEWESDRIAGLAKKLSRRLRDLRAGRKRIG